MVPQIAGKYYLVDSGYPNRPGYLAPYKGTKYHLPEYRNGTMPRGMKETFNYAHSSLRNVVERAFGVLKTKWRIMKLVPSFPMSKQSKIIVACMTLHNFVREHDDQVDHFIQFGNDDEYYTETHGTNDYTSNPGEDDEPSDNDMNEFRDNLAYALYHRY